MRILKTLAFCGATLAVSSSYAATLTASEILGQFNAVVKTTFTSGHDVEGRLVANEVTGGATFYNKPSGSKSAFAAVNAITIDAFSNANIDNGGSVNYQVSNAASYNFNGGGSLTKSSPAFAMTDFTKPLDALAKQLSGLSANSSFTDSDPNSFKFNIDGAVSTSGTAVFSVKGTDTAALFNASSINFSGSANTIIINVYGTSLAQSGGSNFNADAYINSHVIWNFVDATSLSLKSWHGAILAGGAAVSNSSDVEGSLYAKSFTGNGELHDFAFAGTLPTVSPVPEPSSWMMLVGGIAAMLLLARRRSRRA